MMFGIGGAIFFSPFFLLALSLKPEMAIALGILIEVFGFSSGLIGYARNKSVNYHLGTRIVPFTIVLALIGAFIGKSIPATFLEIVLASALFILAFAFLKHETVTRYTDRPLHPDSKGDEEKRPRFDFWQDFKKKPILFITSSIGGLFVGLVSAGLGEINEYNFVKQLKMNLGLSAGTSVFIVAFTALSASVFNVSYFAVADPMDLMTIAEIGILAIPGVLIGAQIGVRVAKKVNRKKALRVLPVLFFVIGVLTVIKAFL
jgi:uncharacterized membrane protein YfcA